ncbi:MAG TPA: MOSC domain-containing protein [Thermohalobaculum sp.]|nr:MOSC domain-containing protein [Thermohalobaculum sp.]
MTWTGRLDHIHITAAARGAMRPLDEALLVAGKGIEGDRYTLGTGTYSIKPEPGRQVTLIEAEALEALARDEGIMLAPHEHRRNLTVSGVPLNHLVGRQFRVGEVLLEGARLNVPCKYLELVTGKTVYAPLLNRSGLNCIIVEGGTIRPGDALIPA